jgi:hypothetical protein
MVMQPVPGLNASEQRRACPAAGAVFHRLVYHQPASNLLIERPHNCMCLRADVILMLS